MESSVKVTIILGFISLIFFAADLERISNLLSVRIKYSEESNFLNFCPFK